MKAVEAMFDGSVLRPAEPLELEEGTRVLVHIEVIEAPHPARPADSEEAREPVLFDTIQTTFKVISDEDDLEEAAVNFWPKEPGGARVDVNRTVRRVPTRPQPVDDSDLLIMEDGDFP